MHLHWQRTCSLSQFVGMSVWGNRLYFNYEVAIDQTVLILRHNNSFINNDRHLSRSVRPRFRVMVLHFKFMVEPTHPATPYLEFFS